MIVSGSVIANGVTLGSGGGVSGTLEDISDVVFNVAPTEGQVLKFDGTNWSNSTDMQGTTISSINDIADVEITSATPNQILSYSGSQWQNVSNVTIPGTLDVTGELSAATPSFTGPTTITGSLTLNGNLVPKTTVSASAPSGGVNGDIWMVIY